MRVSDASSTLALLDRGAQRAVLQTLARTERGYDVDLVTPLISREDPTSGRITRIKQVENLILPTPFEWLDEIERDRIEQIGPWSIMLPFRERKESVDAAFVQAEPAIARDELEYAIEAVASLVPTQLRPVSLETAFQKMPRNTNQGYPSYQTGEYHEAASFALARFTLSAGVIAYIPPAMLFWRGQPRGLKEVPKQRNVWGEAHFLNILEQMFQIPMLAALRHRIEFSAWVHQSVVNEAVTSILDAAMQNILSVDFSGFDRSLPGLIIHSVFTVMKTWFSTTWHPLIDELERSFLSQGLWCPDGIRTGRSGGVPSGSTFTNLVDSLAQLMLFKIVEFRLKNRILISTVQGDDGAHLFENSWDLRDIEDIFTSLGMKMSSDKGGVSRTEVYFLQNVHSTFHRVNGICVGIRPFFRVLNGMLSHERFHKVWNKYLDSIRWRQQVLASQFHPFFSIIVKWLWENDELSALSLNELVDEAGGAEVVKSALEIASFPHGKPTLREMATSPVEQLLHTLNQRGG